LGEFENGFEIRAVRWIYCNIIKRFFFNADTKLFYKGYIKKITNESDGKEKETIAYTKFSLYDNNSIKHSKQYYCDNDGVLSSNVQ
jgi:hypothetical protein